MISEKFEYCLGIPCFYSTHIEDLFKTLTDPPATVRQTSFGKNKASHREARLLDADTLRMRSMARPEPYGTCFLWRFLCVKLPQPKGRAPAKRNAAF